MNPFQLLLKSRKFWIAVTQAVTSTLFLLVGLYLPEYADTVKLIVGFWQVPFALLIAGITIEDAARNSAGGDSEQIITIESGEPKG